MDSFDALRQLLLQLKKRVETPKLTADQRKANVDATIAKLRPAKIRDQPDDQ